MMVSPWRAAPPVTDVLISVTYVTLADVEAATTTAAVLVSTSPSPPTLEPTKSASLVCDTVLRATHRHLQPAPHARMVTTLTPTNACHVTISTARLVLPVASVLNA